MHLSKIVLLLLLASRVVGCSWQEEPPPGAADPELAPVAQRIEALQEVEDLSEQVAHRLVEFSDGLRKRDYAGARGYLTEDFLGTPFSAPEVTPSNEEAALGERRAAWSLERSGRVLVGRDDFLASLEEWLSTLSSVDHVFVKPRHAEFEHGGHRGLLRLTTNVIGRGARNDPFALGSKARAEVRLVAGEWRLSRLLLEHVEIRRRDRPLFTDVASSAGMSLTGPRLGSPGNDSFYWRGAATADFDGDGLFDVFTSSSKRKYLYRNQGDGQFADVTESAGLTGPGQVTGPLFLDYDNDGDQDLFCGHVGWKTDGVPHGDSLRLYRNDGGARFSDVTDEIGLGEFHVAAFSACAADVNNDGWLDIFVSNYNRLDAVYPNSWYRATNGSPNLLLVQQSGKKFQDSGPEAGVAGTSWSYAGAFADFDEDGDQDLYVANDYGDNAFHRNEGKGRFVDVAEELGVLDTGNGMGVTWADLDNDGRLDLYVSNMSSSAGNRILQRLRNSAGGASPVEKTLSKLASGNTIFQQTTAGFRLVPRSHGGVLASWAWGASTLDIDLDGLLDIYVANGFISGDSLKDT